jgi:putative acetyltransferase
MIAELLPQQLEKVMRIWLEVNQSAHDFIATEYWDAHYDLVKNEYFPKSQTFVYEENGTVCGFVSVVNQTYIGALFVEEAFQSRGIGAALVSFCKECFPKLTLSVYVDNPRAVAFYKKQGFAVTACSLSDDGVHNEYSMLWH